MRFSKGMLKLIDFKNSQLFKLSQVPTNTFADILRPLLLKDERVLSAYQTVRDGVVFTDLRILTINVQGAAGKKIDVSSLPYRSIRAFSVESTGVLDSDCELEIYVSSVGNIKFDFEGKADIELICKMISACCL